MLFAHRKYLQKFTKVIIVIVGMLAKHNFKTFWGLPDFSKQNALAYETVEINIVNQRPSTYEQMSLINCSFR